MDGYCAGYQIRLDDGCKVLRSKPGTHILWDDHPALDRAGGDGGTVGFVRLDHGEDPHPCPPLGYVGFHVSDEYNAHRFVEILCAPAASVGPWCHMMLIQAHRVILKEPSCSLSASIDRVEKSVGSAGLQALVAWSGSTTFSATTASKCTRPSKRCSAGRRRSRCCVNGSRTRPKFWAAGEAQPLVQGPPRLLHVGGATPETTRTQTASSPCAGGRSSCRGWGAGLCPVVHLPASIFVHLHAGAIARPCRTPCRLRAESRPPSPKSGEEKQREARCHARAANGKEREPAAARQTLAHRRAFMCRPLLPLLSLTASLPHRICRPSCAGWSKSSPATASRKPAGQTRTAPCPTSPSPSLAG